MRQPLDASATIVTFPAPGTQTPAMRDGRETAMVTTHARSGTFYGWRVVGAAFVLGAFGWGMGFFGPPVFLSVVRETRGWPLVLVSTAVSFHFLVGAVTGARLAALHRRFGVAAVTKAGALSLAAGILGWATVTAPWQLFAVGALSGAGWGAMSAAALNAIVSPWFVRSRPAALAMAYNGGSIGGVIFSPLWVAAIGILGFPLAAAAIGGFMAVTMWVLADAIFSRTPEQMGVTPDGDAPGTHTAAVTSENARPLPGALLWRDRRFLTLAAGMGLGLFAQIGLVAHLFSLLVPALGAQRAGLAMGLVTALAIAGRSLLAWMMPLGADRRLAACAGYALQLSGSLTLAAAGGDSVPVLLLGVVLFGAGFGNATSLPPLIAQVEFVKKDVGRVVGLIVGISQGGYAFAPALFGLVRQFAPHAADAAPGAAPHLFLAAALVQALAVAAFLAGRSR
jgi:Major Facilitator Superfamily